MPLFLSFGSNLGDRAQNIRRAIEMLEQRVGRCVVCSAMVDTAPVDMQSPNRFLNAVAEFSTTLPALEILHITQDIERQLGRTRKSIDGRHFDRTIDIDLLQYDHICCQTTELTLPHPKMGEREFVMQPLAEIAPEVRHAAPPHYTFREMAARQRAFRMVEVVEARKEDWAAVNRLVGVLSPGRYIAWADYERLVATPGTHLALLLHEMRDTHIVGMITLCTTASPTGRKAWVEDVVIEPDYRGHGLSHQLIDWAKQRATQLGQHKLMLTSRPSRTVANALYQSVGFEPRTTNVYQFPL